MYTVQFRSCRSPLAISGMHADIGKQVNNPFAAEFFNFLDYKFKRVINTFN